MDAFQYNVRAVSNRNLLEVFKIRWHSIQEKLTLLTKLV